MKHKSDDYKFTAVQYYLKNNVSMDKTCEIFNCKKSTLKDWVHKYKTHKSITRKKKKHISYKITQEQVKYALQKLKENEQITMSELVIEMKHKYPAFDITPQHLGKVLRDNNKTRKRTKHQHFPKIRFKKTTNRRKELQTFYNKVSKYPLDKIITLDETSVGSGLFSTYSRCELGRRCIHKTDDNSVFKKYTLLVSINNKGVVGKELYEKGGMTKERLLDFMNTYILRKYKNHLIILDNAGSHRNNVIRNAIIKSGNDYVYSIPYTPQTNTTIENYFNQIKVYLKKYKNLNTFEKLEKGVDKAISMVKPIHYKNYFINAYGKKYKPYTPKQSTRRRKPKNYKK